MLLADRLNPRNDILTSRVSFIFERLPIGGKGLLSPMMQFVDKKLEDCGMLEEGVVKIVDSIRVVGY